MVAERIPLFPFIDREAQASRTSEKSHGLAPCLVQYRWAVGSRLLAKTKCGYCSHDDSMNDMVHDQGDSWSISIADQGLPRKLPSLNYFRDIRRRWGNKTEHLLHPDLIGFSTQFSVPAKSDCGLLAPYGFQGLWTCLESIHTGKCWISPCSRLAGIPLLVGWPA